MKRKAHYARWFPGGQETCLQLSCKHSYCGICPSIPIISFEVVFLCLVLIRVSVLLLLYILAQGVEI
ncbi:unnamed protein product [Citrullus colocynthis]|uniref:Uncharacterized protein n=1 Tax=Citrullus colocynthis TaxID=252529 RepID=A0ABP0XYD8_9ROSI